MNVKKILAGVLAAVVMLTVGIVPKVTFDHDFGNLDVMAADAVKSGSCGDNVKWEFDDSTGTLTISGNGNMTNFDGQTVKFP